jgi:NAD-dependent deacetylase
MFSGYKHIVVLTGAGISQAAGLPTYRGPGGLWNDPSKIALSSVEAMKTRREECCAMFWELFVLITQNVDGLHQAAGSHRVCEFHGSLARWRCETCGAEQTLPTEQMHCGEPMRPCAVLFGEEIPAEAEHTAKRALRDCDLFVAIGTSGTVTPAASFVRWAEYAGARRVLLNLEVGDVDGAFSERHAGSADELVPKYFV